MSQPRTGVTVAAAIARSLALLLSCWVRFVGGDIGRTLTMEDGKQFSVFRHARVKGTGQPAAVFIVRFTPAHMSVRQNIRFSLLPMVPLLGMHGFREKYWCVKRQTGECQGIYAWQTAADAHAYADSVALRFMTGRSLPGSVSHQVLDQSRLNTGHFVSNRYGSPHSAAEGHTRATATSATACRSPAAPAPAPAIWNRWSWPTPPPGRGEPSRLTPCLS